MSDDLAFEVTLETPWEEAVDRTVQALAAEGFGVLTRIDVRATMREKLGEDFRPYVILGACNPPLAHRALSRRAEAGLVLPCNVTVEAAESGSLVRIADPDQFMTIAAFGEDPELRQIAAEARARLARVAESLGRETTP